jgi:hypothetical protein
MPRYTHLVVSSEQSSLLQVAQQASGPVPGVKTEAHCQSAAEAELEVLYSRKEGSRLHSGVIALAEPIEY